MSNGKPRFRFHSLGGAGEVGMNCLVFDFGGHVIPVDAGVLFADENDYGVEAVHPDFRPFIEEYKPKEWLITHAHEDHIGAVQAVISAAVACGAPVPTIYAPAFAVALIKNKVLDDSRYPHADKHLEKIVAIEPGSVLDLGDVKVHWIEGRHSTIQSCGLGFEWHPEGAETFRLLHTSDFKIDDREFEDGVKNVESYDVFGGESPDLLLIDSTNSERDGTTISELDILPGLEKLVADSKGRVFLSLFSSNLYRMAAVMKIARDAGRSVAIAGRSMQSVHRIGKDESFYERYCPDFSGVEVMPLEEIARMPPARQLVLCSGSQGEQRSVLMKLSMDQHPHIRLREGDAVILSSKTIPGNEKSVSRLINGLLRLGAKVFWGDYGKHHAQGPIHASGHARRGEIEAVIAHLRPRHVLPIHGELRQLMACAEIAREAGRAWDLAAEDVFVHENHQMLEFGPSKDRKKPWIYLKSSVLEAKPRILRFESFAAPSRDLFLKTRKRAALGGVVTATLDSMGRVRISCEGVMPDEALRASSREDLEERLEEWLHSHFKALRNDGAFSGRDNSKLEDDLADEMSRHVRKLTGARPFVKVFLVGL